MKCIVSEFFFFFFFGGGGGCFLFMFAFVVLSCLVITCCEKDDLLPLLCIMFSCVLSLCHMVSWLDCIVF